MSVFDFNNTPDDKKAAECILRLDSATFSEIQST